MILRVIYTVNISIRDNISYIYYNEEQIFAI